MDDAWAVRQPDADEVGVTAQMEGAAELTTTPRTGEPDRIAWLAAAALFLAAGVAEAAILFAHTAGPIRLPMNDFVGVYVDEGSRAFVLIICGALLSIRRTRELASGLALGVTAIWAARYFYVLRPSRLTRGVDTLAVWLFLAAFGLLVLGAVTVLTLRIRHRARAVERGRKQRKPNRSVAVVLAEVGAVVWVTSTLMVWQKVGIGTVSTGITRTESCCRWTQVDGWDQSGIVVGGVVFLALAVFAAIIRSRALAAGVLFGMILLPLADALRVILYSLAPMPSLYGIRYSREIMSFAKVTLSPGAGLWCGLLSIVLVAAAGVCVLLLGSREDRYVVPELTVAAPTGAVPSS